MSKPPKDYEVGYRKPPKKSQFKKGQSGNDKGRAKGSQNFQKLFVSLQNAKVTINENGKQRSISKQEAVLTQLINKAASGSPQHMRLYFNLQLALEGKESANALPDYQLKKEDEKIIQDIMKRVAKTSGVKDE